GDHKVTWELNRHQHLVTLAKAGLLSGNDNDKYVRELVAQWRSWIKANPYPLGINWASTLEVAFRSLSWIWVDQLLAGAADYAARGGTAGAPGWRLLRAISVLPRLCARLFLICAVAGSAEWNGNSTRI